ncbi:MAG: hypothetical protein ACE5H5_02725 [Nitrospinota bacterium]
MERPYRGYLIGSHKLRGQWFAFGWVPEADPQTKRGPGRDRLVFVGEVTSKEEAEQRVQEDIDRILNQRSPV